MGLPGKLSATWSLGFVSRVWHKCSLNPKLVLFFFLTKTGTTESGCSLFFRLHNNADFQYVLLTLSAFQASENHSVPTFQDHGRGTPHQSITNLSTGVAALFFFSSTGSLRTCTLQYSYTHQHNRATSHRSVATDGWIGGRPSRREEHDTEPFYWFLAPSNKLPRFSLAVKFEEICYGVFSGAGAFPFLLLAKDNFAISVASSISF